MSDLRQQLRTCLDGRACLLGLGNLAYGDDGFGVRLAERLAAGLVEQPDGGMLAAAAGTTPERWVGTGRLAGYDHVIFLDAVEVGAAPGSVVLLDAAGMASRFPQISTHKLSLGLLSRLIEEGGRARAWLLGVQPAALKGDTLSPVVADTLEILAELVLAARAEVSGEANARFSAAARPGQTDLILESVS